MMFIICVSRGENSVALVDLLWVGAGLEMNISMQKATENDIEMAYNEIKDGANS